MKFAFIIMGEFDYGNDRAAIHDGMAQMIGVSSVEEACEAAKILADEGTGCIELCGAFGEDGARRVIKASGGQIPVGYVIHLPEQDELYKKAFPE